MVKGYEFRPEPLYLLLLAHWNEGLRKYPDPRPANKAALHDDICRTVMCVRSGKPKKNKR